MRSVVIVGAGPAGLTAAYEASRLGSRCTVLEADLAVGGLARTTEYKGYLFDIGGHRFFTKVSLVEWLWKEILGDDLLERPRLSRIYYRGKFFRYPLSPWDTLAKLGAWESALCAVSYVQARLRPRRPEEDFETYVVNRFGRRLYEKFFQSYTEKVWGIPCRQIRADWASQRIRNLSFSSVIRNAFRFGDSAGANSPRSLIDRFYYPRRGPGMMWSRMAERVEGMGSKVVFETPVEKIHWDNDRVTHVSTPRGSFAAGHFLSSMPIRTFVRALDPAPPEKVRAAAELLQYRDFLIVALIVGREHLFPDNWLYIHEPGVKVGRVQNFKNWSPEMVPDPKTTCLGMEYFCFEGDELWRRSDEELIRQATREAALIGLLAENEVCDGKVLRVPKAYPVYDEQYEAALAQVREFISPIRNLQFIGRNGMHRYNNQDHSMVTGVLAARNIHGARHDLWQVNADQDYQEEGDPVSAGELRSLDETQPAVPRRL